jgi:molybdate transport system substrate-binding protein
VRTILWLAPLLVGSLGAATAGAAPTVTIAAASDLQTVLPRLAADFEKASGIKARLSFGSSGSFVAQIQNGAPFDVFLSADVDYPRRLVTAGAADGASLYAYGTGQLVLWVRNDNPLDLTKGIAVLRDTRVRHIAIANPDLAPYGRAAVAALKSAHVYDAVQSKLVFGENISQAAQLAQSGNADAGLISHSVALGPALTSGGRFVAVPAASYLSIVQAGVLVSASTNKDAGRAFLRYLKSAEALKTLAAFGFGPPPAR